MATVAQVKAALADQLTLATGIRATPYIPDQISPPAAFVRVTSITWDDYDGSAVLTTELVVLVSRATARIGDLALSGFQDSSGVTSVKAAINANPDLNLGDGTQADVRGYRDLAVEEVAAYGYLGGAFETQVTTPQ